MSFDFSPNGDFARITDGLVSVTLSRPGSPDMAVDIEALRRAIHAAENEPTDGHYLAADVGFSLPADQLPWAPQPGDIVREADGRRWRVLDTRRMTLDTRWHCRCRDLILVRGLDDHVDIERATYAKGTDGTLEPRWETWRTGIAARVQPIGSRPDSDDQRHGLHTRYRITLAESIDLNNNHRIRAADGTVYHVRAVRNPQRIDTFLEVDVDRVT